MKHYNFSAENIDDINTQKSNFFSDVASQVTGLVDLGIFKFENLDLAEKSFWKIFTENHLEIRSDERLVRHFILRKKEKLSKELKTPLFMSDMYGDFPAVTTNEFWKFIHAMFLIFETSHESKSEAIVNTLAEELEKVLEKEQQALSNTTMESSGSKELGKKLHNKIGRKSRQRAGQEPQFDMSKLNSMMSSFGLDPSNPDSLDPSKLMGVMSKMMSSMDSDSGSNPLEQLGLGSDMKDIDMGNLLNQFMPGVSDSKNENLMSSLMSDITSTMGNLESADQVFDMTKQLGQKYQNMIMSGEVDPSEIVGSLMGLMTDKKFTEELGKIDVSKIKPEDMMSKMMSEISPEMIGQLTGGIGGGSELGGLDLGNIGSLVSTVTGLAGGSNASNPTSSVQEKELTPEQIKELEDYYNNLNLNTQPTEPELD